MKKSIQRLNEIHKSITSFIETYERKIEIISEDIADGNFCNSYRKGQIAAYTNVINELKEIIYNPGEDGDANG